jgi:hypothetical protein
MSTWYREQALIAEQAREAAAAAWEASLAATEQRLRVQRERDERWARPRWGDDHRELEALAGRIWRQAYPSAAWPSGWKLRWADTLTAAAPDGIKAIARCDYRRRMVLVDQRYHDRHPEELSRTVGHELAHIVAADGHGPRFKAAFAHIAPPRERTRPMPPDLTLRPARSRIEHRSPDGSPLGAEFVLLVQRAERELVATCGADAPRWVESWRAVQNSATGRWEAVPRLARRRRALSVGEAERRTLERLG